MAWGKGRHPGADRTVVRLVPGAVDDLERVQRKGDPQVVRWALKKMLLLERDPEAGEPLVGSLVGWRKIVVGDRHWRLGWRVGHDTTGAVIVDVAEVWAFGAREDAEVYDEVRARISASTSEAARSLSAVLDRLGAVAGTVEASPEPAGVKPAWLTDVLVKVVGVAREEVDAMSEDEAQARWVAYQTRQQ